MLNAFSTKKSSTSFLLLNRHQHVLRKRLPTIRATAASFSTPEMDATKKRVLVPVANGCEEIETVTIIDVLRRTGRADVSVAKVSSENEKTKKNETYLKNIIFQP